MPADERAASTRHAPIDVSHAGRAGRRPSRSARCWPSGARASEVEARLLRDGVYAIGPRPDLIGRRVDPAAGASAVDDDVGGCRRSSRVRVDVEPDTVLAVAVNGRVEATTRVYRDDGQPVYAALVPPSSLHAAETPVATYEVEPSGELRLVDGDVD